MWVVGWDLVCVVQEVPKGNFPPTTQEFIQSNLYLQLSFANLNIIYSRIKTYFVSYIIFRNQATAYVVPGAVGMK